MQLFSSKRNYAGSSGLPGERLPTLREYHAAAPDLYPGLGGVVLQEVRDITKPLLIWVGGKRRLVPLLKWLWGPHAHRRLVDVFCGGLSVTLGLQPTTALCNDINYHVINFYRWVQKGLVITTPMPNTEEAYYRFRDRFNELVLTGQENTKEAAILFYYLNRTCTNGIVRFNRQGLFNSSYSGDKYKGFFTDLTEYAEEYRKYEFVSSDFQQVDIVSGDFVYADPPYDDATISYTATPFDWDDQVRLAEWLSKHKGPVVVSNNATDRIVALYTRLGFSVSTAKRIWKVGTQSATKTVRELLATKGL